MAAVAPDRIEPEVARRVEEAKAPVTVVAGPYGHPFHPILVTVPIGAWFASVVFDIASNATTGGSAALVEGAYWLTGLGVIGALAAALFGLLDLLAIPRHSRAMRFGIAHLVLNLAVVGMFAASFLWRSGTYDEVSETEAGPMALSLFALAVLGVSGWIGGMLSYRFGVRVAKEAVQADGFR